MVKNLKEGVWQTLTLDKWAIETSDTSPRKECSKITWTLNWPPLITGAISSKIWLVQGLVSAFPQAMRWLKFTDPTVDFFHLFNRNICWCVQPTHPSILVMKHRQKHLPIAQFVWWISVGNFRMRSKGSRFTLGVRGWGCVRSTLRNRS